MCGYAAREGDLKRKRRGEGGGGRGSREESDKFCRWSHLALCLGAGAAGFRDAFFDSTHEWHEQGLRRGGSNYEIRSSARLIIADERQCTRRGGDGGG
jgi:hypothetical protein